MRARAAENEFGGADVPTEFRGAVVVTDLVTESVVDAVLEELRPALDRSGLEQVSGFNGALTNRFNGILREAPSAAPLIEHDMVVALADAFLLPHCANYQIGSLTAIEIMPGESEQALHRDDSLYPVQLAGVELQIGVMWALCDFTVENGATRVVPGSHRFLRSRRRCRKARPCSTSARLGTGAARTAATPLGRA